MRRTKRSCIFSEAVFVRDTQTNPDSKSELCKTPYSQGTLRGGDFGLRCPLHGAPRIAASSPKLSSL